MTLTQVGNPKRARILKECGINDNGASSINLFLNAGCKNVIGFQNRYIYLIDKTCKITVPILPFSKIDEMGAGMYKGKRVSLQDRKNAAVAHSGEHCDSITEGAFDATLPLKTEKK